MDCQCEETLPMQPITVLQIATSFSSVLFE